MHILQFRFIERFYLSDLNYIQCIFFSKNSSIGFISIILLAVGVMWYILYEKIVGAGKRSFSQSRFLQYLMLFHLGKEILFLALFISVQKKRRKQF